MHDLTALEMAQFISASRKRQIDEWKMLAQVGYSSGNIGSMAFAKRRPSFKEVFNFPEEDKEAPSADVYEAQMLAWTEQMNRADRKRRKGGK